MEKTSHGNALASPRDLTLRPRHLAKTDRILRLGNGLIKARQAYALTLLNLELSILTRSGALESPSLGPGMTHDQAIKPSPMIQRHNHGSTHKSVDKQA